MGLPYYGMSLFYKTCLDVINYVFIFLFFLELVMKFIGFGIRKYMRDPANVLDAFVVLVSGIELLMTTLNNQNSSR